MGRVIACEPDRANVVRLRALAERHPSLEVVEAAVTSEAGTVRFAPPPDGTRTGIGHISAEGIAVKAVRLDDLADGHEVAAIFTDTEGNECNVLRGAAATMARCRPLLVVEVVG